jgi:hypothetical protein
VRTARRAQDMEQVPMLDSHAFTVVRREINSSKPKALREEFVQGRERQASLHIAPERAKSSSDSD